MSMAEVEDCKQKITKPSKTKIQTRRAVPFSVFYWPMQVTLKKKKKSKDREMHSHPLSREREE